MFWISDRPSGDGYPGTDNKLVVVTYNNSGWDHYPAEEAFGAPLAIDTQTPGSGENRTRAIADLRIRRAGEAGGEFLLAWVNAGEISVGHGSIARGFVRRALPEKAADTVSLAVQGAWACSSTPDWQRRF